MNKKRWGGLAAAAILALIWVTISFSNQSKEVDLPKLGTANGLTEVVVTPGASEEKIALLTIDGTIAAGQSSGLFNTEGYNHQFFLSELEAIAADPTVKGMFLEVNSPGGGVYESAEIARAIKGIQATRNIPFYVAMKNTAASGGYYVAASADKIYATEETVTGSIGVIMSGTNLSGLMKKLGVENETVKSGELKDIGSTTREWTEKDRQVLQDMIDSSYDRFVKIVADGRGMPEDVVRKIADGRIYDGVQARENGLVDELGFPEDALAAMEAEHDLTGASVIKYEASGKLFGNPVLDSLFNSKASFWGRKKVSDTQVLNDILTKFGSSEAPRMMYLYGGE